MASPESDYAATASRLIEQQGLAQGQAALQRGQIWGGFLNNLGQHIGQTVAEAPFRSAQLQELQQRREMGTMQLDQMRRQQAAEQAYQSAISTALNPDGSINFEKFSQAAAGTPAALKIPEVAQHITAFQESTAKLAKLNAEVDSSERDQISALANAADSFPDPKDKAATLLTGIASAIQQKSLRPEKGLPILHQIVGPDGQPDVANVQRVIDSMKTLSAADVEKRAQAAHAAASAASAQAALPGVQAESAIKQQVAAGTVGGISPEQQQQNVLRGREVTLGEQRLRAELPHITAQTELATQNAKKAAMEAQQLEQVQGIAGPGGAVPDVPVGQRNEAFLQTLAPPIASTVKALAEGRMAFPSSFALKTPYWQGILQAVAKYDPSFDAINYNARSKTRADFTSGKSAQQVNALNTVIGHLSELSDKAEALNNTSMPFVNSVKNWLATAGGSSKVTNFETAKKAVADELTRVYRQAGGAEADIKSWQTSLNAAQSPEQLHGAFATIGDLLESKLQAMQNQYQQGMGINDVQMITSKSRTVLDKLEGKSSQTRTTAGRPKTLEKFGATYELGDDGLYHKVTKAPQ